jgi:heptosyltransferase-2
MVTPAIENLIKHHRGAQITLVGSAVSAKLFEKDVRISKVVVEDTSKSIFSLLSLFRTARGLGEQDLVISFKNSFFTKFFMFFVQCENKVIYEDINKDCHNVEKYNEFMNKTLDTDYAAGDLMLRVKVALALAHKYDIVLLGGKNEIDICEDIENQLKENGIENCTNLAGKTSVIDLAEKIAALDLFLTIDSGPMQIAGIYRVNTLIIPTSYEKIEQRNQWKNPLETIVYKYIDPYSDEEHKDFTPSAQDVLDLLKV